MAWVKQRKRKDSKQGDKIKKSASIHGDSKYSIFVFLLSVLDWQFLYDFLSNLL